VRLHLPHQPRPAVLPDLHSPPLVRFGLLAVESAFFAGMRTEEAMSQLSQFVATLCLIAAVVSHFASQSDTAIFMALLSINAMLWTVYGEVKHNK